MTVDECKFKIHSFIHVCMHSVEFIDVASGKHIARNNKDRVFVLMKLLF